MVPVSYEKYLSDGRKHVLYSYNEATLSTIICAPLIAALTTLSDHTKDDVRDLVIIKEFQFCADVANYAADYGTAIVKKNVSICVIMLIIKT